MGEVSTFAESKDLTLSNSSKASFSSLVIRSSRDSIPPSPAATFTTQWPSQICETQLAEDCPDQRHGVDYGNCTCAGSDQGPQSAKLVHVYFLGLTLTGHLIGPQPAKDKNLLRGIGLLQ